MTTIQFELGGGASLALPANVVAQRLIEGLRAQPTQPSAARPRIGEYLAGQGGIYVGDILGDDGVLYGLIAGKEEDIGRAKWGSSGDDVRYQLSIGRAPTLLGLTFDNRLSFILTNRLELKRILLLDIVTTGQQEADDEIAKFDADFTLVAAEIEGALETLVGELGGLVRQDSGDLVDQARNAMDGMAKLGAVTFTGADGESVGIGNDLDPLYQDAKRIVLTERKPSISLVQRHLRIGYNRAARLIEQMEMDGLVSAIQSDGTREVLAA